MRHQAQISTINYHIEFNLSKISAQKSIKSSSLGVLAMNSVYNEINGDQKRISILVPKKIHKKIKLLALEADKSMKEFITNLIVSQADKQVMEE